MAKKEISGYVKLQINGGQANPAPPVGPALGQRGINIMEFCKAFYYKITTGISFYKRSGKNKKWVKGAWKKYYQNNYKKTT